MAPAPRARARSHTASGPAVMEAKRRLRALGARATKGLGQHFLVDRRVLGTVVGAADLAPHDTVVEVGPGLGTLTAALLETGANVVAVEVDPGLASAVESRFSGSRRLAVINADVLDLDPADLLPRVEAGESSTGSYKVVANLPYYVAAAILRHFLEASSKPALTVVMVQKEVGQSIAAGPGDLGLLGVSVQVYGKPTIVGYVPPSAFYPEPKVDSAIVRIDVYARPLVDVDDIAGFFEVVRAGFSAPRKQLRNSLSIGLDVGVTEAADLLVKAGIGPERRPGTMSIEEWAGLHRALAGRGKR
jgi:16S rRNA (adenine1518-N6/adenine1519-N6)-dimethyltransferase